jgi:type 1 fimbriae regulatory protein FimB/type 1 fimbriae regulatory protein FimE
VQTLIDVAKANRYGHRDATMILLAYRHGFRASELTLPPASPRNASIQTPL